MVLYWAGDNLGQWDYFIMNHAPGARSIARSGPADQCTTTVLRMPPLCKHQKQKYTTTRWDIGIKFFFRIHLGILCRLERGIKPMLTSHNGRCHFSLSKVRNCVYLHGSPNAQPRCYGCQQSTVLWSVILPLFALHYMIRWIAYSILLWLAL